MERVIPAMPTRPPVDVVPVHRPDRFSSVALLGGAAGVDAELTGAFVSCVEQPIAQTATKHKQVSKRSARLRLIGAKDFILVRPRSAGHRSIEATVPLVREADPHLVLRPRYLGPRKEHSLWRPAVEQQAPVERNRQAAWLSIARRREYRLP